MAYNRRRAGAEHEKMAGAYLEERGYRILEYNYRCKKGEIDIVAKDGEYLVFCEVKYRRGEEKGYPSQAVDVRKQRILSRCALYYLMEKGIADVPCRFDVAAILGKDVDLIKDAFQYRER